VKETSNLFHIASPCSDARLRVKLTRQIPASCRHAFCPDCTSYSRAWIY